MKRGTVGSPDQHEFCLQLAGGRAGCRQRLYALLPGIRVGMEVPIRHDGRGRVIIDTPAMGIGEDAAWGYKALDDPPPVGIADDNVDLEKERRKAVAVVATVLSMTPYAPMGIGTENFDVHVRVAAPAGEPYETVVKRELIPFYATHLARPGRSCPRSCVRAARTRCASTGLRPPSRTRASGARRQQPSQRRRRGRAR